MGADAGADRVKLSLDHEQRLGVPPFIAVNGKAAIHRNWQTGPFEAPDLWRNRLRRHRGNLGVVMGHGRVGLDLDLYKPEGIETFRALHDLEWLPDTTWQNTPSGGVHLLYSYDPEIFHIGCGTFDTIRLPDGSRLPGGAEWKGTGGYLVFYGWTDDPIMPLHLDLAVRLGSKLADETATGQHPRDLHPHTIEAVHLLEDHFGGHSRTVRHTRDGKPYVLLTRPGKDARNGSSCSVGESTPGVTFFFTPNWPPFSMQQVIDVGTLRRLAGQDGPHVRVSSRSAGPVVPAQSLRSERQVWIWRDMLPAGQLAMAAGYEKLGKSTALVWVAARLTRGDLPGDLEGRPVDVCFISAEDDGPHVLKPRIVAAGADLARFYLLNPDPTAELFTLSAVRDVHPALVVFDPISVFIHLKPTSSENGEVAIRQALQPFAELASEGITVLGVRHLRKSAGGDNPYDAVLGSRAWSAAVRAMLFFTPDPEHRDEPKGLMFPRGNLSAATGGFSYRLESTPVNLDDGTSTEVPLFKLTGGTAITLDDALGPRQTPSERDKAERFLTQLLAEGRMPYEDILAAAIESNISTRTLRRAKKDLGVVSEYVGKGRERVTFWRLPNNPKDGQDGQDGHD